jgi:DNA-binding CsgD family transcriptional regulator
MKDLYSGVRFYRRLGRPAFGERERKLVDISFHQTCWLHPQNGASAAAKDALMNLSPRERQVLLLLLKGDSRKQVAKKLTLSEHTVADYLKVIYRKLDVCSRAELLTKYLHNGQVQAVPPPAFSKSQAADRSAG